jgi:DNA-binding CsgD family transcriptional regulator
LETKYQLSKADIQLLREIAAGNTYKEISVNLGIPVNILQRKTFALLRKLHVRTKAEAAIKFLKEHKE